MPPIDHEWMIRFEILRKRKEKKNIFLGADGICDVKMNGGKVEQEDVCFLNAFPMHRETFSYLMRDALISADSLFLIERQTHRKCVLYLL